jgi:putative membrane protein
MLFAAERTLLAWQRTAIAVMGFGFVVERFGLTLPLAGGEPLSPWQRGFSLWLGVGLLVVGALVSIVSALQYRKVLRSLDEKETPRGHLSSMGVWLSFLLAFVAFALAAYFVAAFDAQPRTADVAAGLERRADRLVGGFTVDPFMQRRPRPHAPGVAVPT